MDLFGLALEKEKKAETTYRELAEKCNDKGFKAIFQKLAEDELKHYKTVEKLRSENADMENTKIMADARYIIENMKKDRKKDIDCKDKHSEIYETAQEFEKESEDLYRKMGEEEQDSKKKAILIKLADEEKKHYILMQNLIELMREPEGLWLEDAEWHHLDEY